MEVILFQIIGAITFLLGTIALGLGLRSRPTRDSAERLSRISHLLFWLGLVVPEISGVFYPGLAAFDALLGWPSLPCNAVCHIVGTAALSLGIYYLVASNVALRALGSGFAAFGLTRRVVSGRVYESVRNPMSLGTYLVYTGISLLAGSTWLLLGTLLAVVPVHAFNLLYFEQLELRLRHGEAYEAYRKRVPLLIPAFLPRVFGWR